MLVFRNILIAIALWVGCIILAVTLESTLGNGQDNAGAVKAILGLMVLGTALWASISSHRLEFRNYRTSLSVHPVAVFLGVAALWIVFFPMFLTVRHRIKNGIAEALPGIEGSGSTEAPVPPLAPFQREAPPVPSRPQATIPPPLPSNNSREVPAAPVPVKPTPAPSQAETLEQLERLAGLKERGMLSEEEFTQEKRKLLGI